MLTTGDNETGILAREDNKTVCLQLRIMKQGYMQGRIVKQYAYN
jgi:hypothetical protein